LYGRSRSGACRLAICCLGGNLSVTARAYYCRLSRWRRGNATIKLRPGWDTTGNKSKGHPRGVSARVAFETNCRIDPVPLVVTLTIRTSLGSATRWKRPHTHKELFCDGPHIAGAAAALGVSLPHEGELPWPGSVLWPRMRCCFRRRIQCLWPLIPAERGRLRVDQPTITG